MHRIYTFIILMAFWVVLSGKLDSFHLSLGVLSAAIVTALSADIFFKEEDKKGRLAEAFRFVAYIPWLLKEIVLSTFHVSSLALSPRMMDRIDPQVVTFRTTLTKDISRVAFANSITLTPGTITIRIVDGEYYVHALSHKAADGLPGEMESRVAAIFGESSNA